MSWPCKEHIRSQRHKRILELTNYQKGNVILDCSCADGKFLNRLHSITPTVELFGIDISAEDIEKAKTNFPFARFSQEDADALSFKNNTFDVAFSIMSLHHYKNANDFFREVFRALKPSGILYLADLIPKYTWAQDIQNRIGCSEPYHFEKFYSVQNIEALLKPFGWRVAADHKIALAPQRIRLLKILYSGVKS